MTAVVKKVARVVHAIVKLSVDYNGYYGANHETETVIKIMSLPVFDMFIPTAETGKSWISC